jgi:hypothetical protein
VKYSITVHSLDSGHHAALGSMWHCSHINKRWFFGIVLIMLGSGGYYKNLNLHIFIFRFVPCFEACSQREDSCLYGPPPFVWLMCFSYADKRSRSRDENANLELIWGCQLSADAYVQVILCMPYVRTFALPRS